MVTSFTSACKDLSTRGLLRVEIYITSHRYLKMLHHFKCKGTKNERNKVINKANGISKRLRRTTFTKKWTNRIEFRFVRDGCPGLDSNQHILANAAT